ncbi:T9SS type A sorting domain-containing protein [Algibacter mikhailovii]|uniref:T9SS type A sorting domain-containing protein n=1 Tax=Algibacter mikhailovii TaxID=425498 RepID=UPI0024956132|nr:T9SS type A sorting domain-containing protein [Algibacter mikhailovii]
MMNNITLKSLLICCFTFFSLCLTAQNKLPSDDIVRLQNVETGQFLTTAGGSSQPVTMSDTGEALNTHWTFVASGAYYNIDSASETGGTGILRATGGGFSGGAYAVVSTLKAPPAADTDKTWTIEYDTTTDTYRFGSRTTGRFLYQEEDGTVTHTTAANTDDRSNWKLVPLTAPIPVGTPFGFQNVETGEFLTAAAGSNQPVTMSATGEAQNTLWTLEESGDYYNIDSASDTGGTGILRAPGAGSSTGAYVILSTLKAPPAADTDKTWTIDYNPSTDTYRFESRTAGRYLYQNEDGTVTHTVATDTDDRSNWKLVPLVQNEIPVGITLRFQNAETEEFLTAAGASNESVTMSETGDADNVQWTLIETESGIYNIDSESESGATGILRATGSGANFAIVSTNKAPPTTDTDKIWTISYNDATDTYRFESNSAGRFLYQNEDGTVTHTVAPDTDNRSNWKLVEQTPEGVAPDEDTNPNLACPASGEFQNDETRNVDIPGAVNVGTADDRTCYSDYSESNVYEKTWGVYNITAGSNHWDAPNTLQPRIERSLPRSQETGVGSYARFKGTLRILEVGDTAGTNQDGSYLMQAKGKHTGGGGPADPAICLYLAMPVYGDDGNGNQVQVSFDIFREQINYRGGSGADGRTIVFLKNVAKNEIVEIELEVGFRADPNNPNLKIHYSDAKIGGEAFNWNIPEPERGTESGIRYGVYRVKGGRAQMRWADTTYEKVEVVDTDPAPTDVVRLRNVETGQFLTAGGGSSQPVTMSATGDAQNTHWTFIESGTYYNIDSESETGGTGILRSPGAGGPAGPYVIVSTLKSPPAGDTDKTWTIHYDATTDTYRFGSRTTGRFLYQEEDGTVTHKTAVETDDRSVWKSIPIGPLLESELSSTNVNCAGADDGTANVSVTGGIEPYTYLWSSGETTATISNLAAGIYSVTVTDAINSNVTASIEITAPSEIVVEVSDNIVLYSGYDGADQCATIGVTAVTGGTAPYQFEWSTGESAQTIEACPNSTQIFTVTISDANGCEITEEITVEVIDVGCGTAANSKVQMCHKGKTICVAEAAVQAHLDHGDTLGECTVDPANAIVSVQTFPNPFITFIKANIEVNTSSIVNLILLNMNGNPVAEQTNQVNNGGVETIELPVNALPIGIYYLQIFIENQLYSTEVFIKN